MQIGTSFCDSLLKLREAALYDAVDKVNDFLAVILFIAVHDHAHQSVGQVGVEHFQLRVRGALQMPPPVGDAFAAGKVDHPAQYVWRGVLKNQHPAGLLLLLDHGVEGLDQRGHVKGIHQLQRLPKSFQQILLNAFQQCEAVAVVGVEGRAVQPGSLSDLLDGDLVDGFFLQKR